MLDGLTPTQRQAVTHPEGPLLVLAGAGAGKTAVLCRRLAWLVDGGARASEVLALTFTHKAAAELRERAEEMIGRTHETLRVTTFHSWAIDLCRVHGVDLGLLPARDRADETDRALLLLERLGELDLVTYDLRGDPARSVGAIIKRIDRCRDALVTPEAYGQWADERLAAAARPRDAALARREVEFARVFAAHDRWLDDAGVEDFGMSITQAIDLLRAQPDRLAAVREATRHVLVDEFQDTNHSQAQLLYLVADSAASVVVVGDDDQGIYRFRGATTKNLADFRDRYAGCQELRLERNFRSHQAILDAAGAVVSPLPDRTERRLFADRAATGPTPRFWAAPDPLGEARAVAGEVRRLAGEGMPFEEQAVLMRAVRTEVAPVLEALEAEGLPYQVRGGLGLFERREVRDAVAWLRAVTDPADGQAHLRAAADPRWGMPWGEIAAAVAEADGAPVTDRLVAIATRHEAHDYLALLDQLGSEAARGTALEALRAVIDLSGLRSGALAVGGAQGAARLEGLAALERLAAAIVRRAPALEGAGLAGRLAALAAVDYRGEVGAAGQRIGVQVLTVHQAKGLEFDAVFVVGMVQRRWPGPQQRGTDIPDALLPEALPSERDAHVAESRRVAYVAMTRARHHLVLSAHAANAAGVPQRVAQFYEEAREVVGAAVEEVDPSPEGDALRQVAALRERFERAALRAAEAHDAAEADERRQTAVAAAEELVDARVAAQRGPLPQPVPAPVAAPARPGQTLTVTDVTTYLRCPLQYRFGRVDRIPQRDSPERRIGIGVHTALEGHYRPDGDGGDGARLVARVERELSRLGVSEQAEGRQALRRARERLPDYAQRNGSRGEQAAAVEQSFTLALGSHRVRGRIDRIDRYPDGYQLVDYKTGAPPSSPQGDASWTAVRLYAAGAQETWSFVPRGAALHYVLDGEQRPVDCDPPLVAEATALAREAADDVAAERFDPRPGWHCRACDFRLLCPAQDR